MNISKPISISMRNEFDTVLSLLDDTVSVPSDLNPLEIKLIEDISSEILKAKEKLIQTNQVCLDTIKDIYLALLTLASNHMSFQGLSGAVNCWKNCCSRAFNC